MKNIQILLGYLLLYSIFSRFRIFSIFSNSNNDFLCFEFTIISIIFLTLI